MSHFLVALAYNYEEWPNLCAYLGLETVVLFKSLSWQHTKLLLTVLLTNQSRKIKSRDAFYILSLSFSFSFVLSRISTSYGFQPFFAVQIPAAMNLPRVANNKLFMRVTQTVWTFIVTKFFFHPICSGSHKEFTLFYI